MVWHRGLLKKLESIGIRWSLLDWVQDYLSGWKKRVVINNVSSDWGSIKAGLPVIVDCMSIAMSFIKIIKNSGFRIDPWGNPALMEPQSDDTLLITTLFFHPDR
jgi:hypothetical protein